MTRSTVWNPSSRALAVARVSIAPCLLVAALTSCEESSGDDNAAPGITSAAGSESGQGEGESEASEGGMGEEDGASADGGTTTTTGGTMTTTGVDTMAMTTTGSTTMTTMTMTTSSDASSTDDTATPGDGVGCAGADIICDDFEAGVGAMWAYTGATGLEPQPDNTKFVSGGQSITFAQADTRGAFIYPMTGPTGSFYVRAYVNFERATSEMGGHVAFIVGATAPENGVEVRLGASNNFNTQEIMTDLNFIGDGSELTQFANGDVTGGQANPGGPGHQMDADTWYCIEGFFNTDADEFQLWVDGTEITGLHVTDWQGQRPDWAPELSIAKIGVHNYSGSIGQVWYDDVAVATQRIGCS